MPSDPPTRRFNNQRFLLTYSHLEPSIPDVHEGNIRGSLIDFLDDLRLHLLSIPSFHWCEAVTELHADGTPHVHAVVVLRQRLQARPSYFDVDRRHPDVAFITNGGPELYSRRHYIRKGARTPEECHTPKECKKEGCPYDVEPLRWGEVPAYSRTAKRWTWGDALTSSKTIDEFTAALRQHATRDFVLHHKSIMDFASEHFNAAEPYDSPYAPESFHTTGAMDDWVADVFSEVCLTPTRVDAPFF